jgi:hypothetical protein
MEITAAKDIIFALASSGVCVAYARGVKGDSKAYFVIKSFLRMKISIQCDRKFFTSYLQAVETTVYASSMCPHMRSFTVYFYPEDKSAARFLTCNVGH